jgi:hypothetical protein
VKRSGRDETIWVVTHRHMEITQGISLYRYPYLKLAKTPFFFIIFYVFSSTKLEKKRVERPGWKGGSWPK